MKKTLTAAGILILISLCAYFVSVRIGMKRPASIEEIPDTHLKAAVNNTDCRYFVISHPPEDLYELKALAEDYTEQYISSNGIGDTEDEIYAYHWVFFRETKVVNTDWKQSDGYFSVDRIEDHFNDIIVSVWWKAEDTEKNYTVRRLSRKSGSGNIIETKRFAGDKLVE